MALSQIKVYLNSRPLIAVPSDGEGIDILTPGHFLIGRPLMSLSDLSCSYQPVSLLKCWYLCQNIVRQFWQQWSKDYLVILRRHHKWHKPTRNLSIRDIVTIHDDKRVIACNWPLGRIISTHCQRWSCVCCEAADSVWDIHKANTQDSTTHAS